MNKGAKNTFFIQCSLRLGVSARLLRNSLFSLFILLFSFSSLSCDLFYGPMPVKKFPAGMGGLSLMVSGRNVAPVTPTETDISEYRLEFTSTGMLPITLTRTPANLSIIELPAGTYTLTVTAYSTAVPSVPIMRGQVPNIVITEGQITNHTVNLFVIDDEGNGTFSWNITFPADITSAVMEITKVGENDPFRTYNLLTNGSGEDTLPSGYYRIFITLKRPGYADVEYRNALDINSNLVSRLELDIDERYINSTKHNVRFNFNNELTGNAAYVEVTVEHYDFVVQNFSDPTRDVTVGLYRDNPPDKWTFAGWYFDDVLYDISANAPVIEDMTLEARWSGAEQIDLTGITSNNIILQTFNWLGFNQNPGEYTMVVGSNTTTSTTNINADHTLTEGIELNIRGYGARRTITYGNARTLDIQQGTLSLGNNITIAVSGTGNVVSNGGEIHLSANAIIQTLVINDGKIKLLDDAVIQTLTIDVSTNNGLDIDLDLTKTARINALDLRGTGTIDEVRNQWTAAGKQVIKDTVPSDVIDKISAFSLRNFTNSTDTQQISGDYRIASTGVDKGQLVQEEFNLHTEVAKFATATGDMVITVPHNISLFERITIPTPVNPAFTLTIKSEGSPVTIAQRVELNNGANNQNPTFGLFTVPAGTTLIIENIIIDGNRGAVSSNNNTTSLIRISDGTFVMNAGAVLQNNTAYSVGGGVWCVNGNFTMKAGSEIKDNYVRTASVGAGGGVRIEGGTFDMEGGIISGNNCRGGGGVFVSSYGTSIGTFNMSGGEVRDNISTTNYGAGVLIATPSNYTGTVTFNMSGGKITGNNDTNNTSGGGGVSLSGQYSSFNMSGGEISGNTTLSGRGGGVYCNITGNISDRLIIGGSAVISGNTSNSSPNNLYLYNSYITLGEQPTSDMEIHVSTSREDGLILNNGADDIIAGYFTLDMPGKIKRISNGQLFIDTPKHEIHNEADLRKVGTGEDGWTLHVDYVLMADITLTSEWIPIGSDVSKPFTGTFYGNGKKITGLKIDNPTGEYLGLFGYLGDTSAVKDLSLVDVEISGRMYIGGLAGYSLGSTIENCNVQGNITGINNFIGGLMGYSYSALISRCYFDGTVSGATNVGGLTGQSYSNAGITYCYTTGTVTGTSSNVGGISGYVVSGIINSCYSTADVTGTGTTGTTGTVGGIAGYATNVPITNCYSTGNITGRNNVGGIIGNNVGNGGLSRFNYATGTITGVDFVGGIIGRNDGTGRARDNVALNPQIIRSDGTADDFGRAAGAVLVSTNITHIYVNFYARSDMVLPPGITLTLGRDEKDGESITAAQYGNQAWWESVDAGSTTAPIRIGGFDISSTDASTIWLFRANGLPVLRGMPNEDLQNPQLLPLP